MAAILAVGMGMAAVAGTAISNRASSKAMEADARSEGVRQAGIWFGAERRGEMLMAQMSGITDARIQNRVEIGKAQARAASDAKVAAASAGVSGQSTEFVAQETARTAAEAHKSLNDRIKAERMQLQTNYVDNYLNAGAQLGGTEFRGVDNKTRFLNMALSFGTGYMSGRSMGGGNSGGGTE